MSRCRSRDHSASGHMRQGMPSGHVLRCMIRARSATRHHPTHPCRTLASSAAPRLGHLSPRVIGGKAANLGRLQGAGLPVPDWFCVTTAVFRDVAAAAWTVIDEELRPFRPARSTTPRPTISARATKAIHATGLSDAIAPPCTSASGIWRPSLRSSPCDRRSRTKTRPPPRSPGRWTAISSCPRTRSSGACSTASPRAFRRGRWPTGRFMGAAPVSDAGVIVQRMIDSRVSGVLFTANPTTGDPTETVVSAAIGVGEGVVADRAESDTFFVDAATLTLRRRVLRRSVRASCSTPRKAPGRRSSTSPRRKRDERARRRTGRQSGAAGRGRPVPLRRDRRTWNGQSIRAG